MHPIKLLATLMLFFAMASTPYIVITHLTTGDLQVILYGLWSILLYALLLSHNPSGDNK